MAPYEHLVLTRFSVRATPDARPHPLEWLEDRLRLLEAFCLPAIAAQSETGLSWLVLCDETTAPAALARLEELLAAVPRARVLRTSAHRSSLPAVLALLDPATEVLVTSRVDSDDALAVDFASRVATYVRPFCASGHDALLLSFPEGFKLDVGADRVFASFQPHNAFLTAFERVGRPGGLRTVQSGNHGLLHREHPLHQDASGPAWLQVVHGANVTNHVYPADLPQPRSVLDGRFALRQGAASGRAGAPPPQPQGSEARAVFRQGLEDALNGEAPTTTA